MAEYRIKDWDKNFENNRTRELKRMEFVLVPNKHDGDGFRTLISKPRGTALFGAWVLILQVASKCDPRGTLVRSDGTPHTPETIARMTGSDTKLIKAALDILIHPEIGWIEDAELNMDFIIPPSRTANAGDKRRAVGRVDRYLVPERGVLTPKGKMTERPLQCQWCDCTPSPSVTGLTAILAHHVLGYGNLADDLAVMFVCRSCHGFFESGKFTTKMVIDRFGDQWAPRNIAGDSGATASDSSAYAGAHASNGIEQNGREGNGRESAPQREPIPFPSGQTSELGIEGWTELIEAAASAGMSFDPEPSSDLCQKVWRKRDFENRKNCIQGILARVQCGQYSHEDSQYVPTLSNYVQKNLWRESLRPRIRGQPKDKTTKATELFAKRLMREKEHEERQRQVHN
jgi:hypothetical protein